MVASFKHYNHVTERRAVSVQPTCSCFFYISHGLKRVSEIGKNYGNPDLVCENIFSCLTIGSLGEK